MRLALLYDLAVAVWGPYSSLNPNAAVDFFEALIHLAKFIGDAISVLPRSVFQTTHFANYDSFVATASRNSAHPIVRFFGTIVTASRQSVKATLPRRRRVNLSGQREQLPDHVRLFVIVSIMMRLILQSNDSFHRSLSSILDMHRTTKPIKKFLFAAGLALSYCFRQQIVRRELHIKLEAHSGFAKPFEAGDCEALDNLGWKVSNSSGGVMGGFKQTVTRCYIHQPKLDLTHYLPNQHQFRDFAPQAAEYLLFKQARQASLLEACSVLQHCNAWVTAALAHGCTLPVYCLPKHNISRMDKRYALAHHLSSYELLLNRVHIGVKLSLRRRKSKKVWKI